MEKQTLELRLTVDELRLVNNALNEVCNGVDLCDAEFAIRLGSPREVAQDLLLRVSELLK
jgi:hypothetical protein